jgi:hypothetical protein
MNNIINIPDDFKEESQETMNIIKNDGEGADKVLSQEILDKVLSKIHYGVLSGIL